MRTFAIQTLGCKVNQYESEQVATLLRARGWVLAEGGEADLHIINTCAVTTEATSKSRQMARRATRAKHVAGISRTMPLPVLDSCSSGAGADPAQSPGLGNVGDAAGPGATATAVRRSRVIVMGCWATSDKAAAQALPGVDAVIGHHDAVADTLNALLDQWFAPIPDDQGRRPDARATDTNAAYTQPEQAGDDGWMGERSGSHHTSIRKSQRPARVKQNPDMDGSAHPATNGAGPRQQGDSTGRRPAMSSDAPANSLRLPIAAPGAASLPILDAHATDRARAFLKVQDGCDAHCTYCIIPKLRPALWSKPIDAAIAEAQALVDAGHREIVLTGIFLGAYGHSTALRRRQGMARADAAAQRPERSTGPNTQIPLGALARALCTHVRGLHRLRFSSLEPMDLTDELIAVLRDLPQVVPHFHLPLQSGSSRLLRRMNRQYTREDFLRMLDRVYAAFDRPALTTDIICGFPGETDAEFEQTLDIVERARFIHIHAFSFSPRPGTAAARWTADFIPSAIARQRIEQLRARALEHSFNYRRQFIGQTVELLVERSDAAGSELNLYRGRCERYFDVHFSAPAVRWGDVMPVRIDRITRTRTFGTPVV